MMTFLEYAHATDQIAQHLRELRAESQAARDPHKAHEVAEAHFHWIAMHLPESHIKRLPDNARADLASIIAHALMHDINHWNDLKTHLRLLWDHPTAENKDLGKFLLNDISAKVMEEVQAPFFLSYSGQLPKSAVHALTGKSVKVVDSRKDYGFFPLRQMMEKVRSDYATFSNNQTMRMQQ